MPTLCFYRQDIVQPEGYSGDCYFVARSNCQQVSAQAIEFGSTVEFAVPFGSEVEIEVSVPDEGAYVTSFVAGQERGAVEGSCFGALVLEKATILEGV